ncbi:phosphotransferase family protein [Sphingobium sp. SCG-1]|uniref:phosphotransferase family protein n=1 Tax=Sphingobium sp. SCG-1 TaxID=2072936 RepID=UPI000CD69048|nr:phosphotransferase family protein [Sphingobium sp. SCG-1]AUW58943.1 phosphotransferase family protein [Sphingobium sp. SCG-1]
MSKDDREQRFAGSGAIREGHGFDAMRLETWLAEHVNGFEGPLSVEQFKGGQSNPTYKLITPGKTYVMRRKPPGLLLKGAHAIEREYRVISALGDAGFPVAQAYALCEDAEVIGTPFYIMDMVDGRIFWDSTLPGLNPADRAQHFDTMNATIARLHSIDPEAAGLADYGRPGNYFERQITRWSRQYEQDEAAGRLADMDWMARWLPDHIPAGDETAVVHGDFRADNMIWHATEPRILAVLDWELSTLGHPLGDFTYHLMMYHLPPHIIGGFKGADLHALGIPSEQDYVAAYCHRTGRAGIDNLNFYLSFNMFRFAAIIHGIKGRIARGTAASPEAANLVAVLPELAAIARGTAQS